MKILGFDIETYKELFCIVGIMYDTYTKEELWRRTIAAETSVTSSDMDAIKAMFDEADYIVSFNGKRFDLPVLAGIDTDLKRSKSIPVKYVYSDAQALISYDEHNNSMAKRHCSVKEWNEKHFDLLANCLLRYSLKQWEMYQGLRIRELPYAPDAKLTDEMKAEIKDYCAYDVWAMMQIFWKYGYDKGVAGKTTLLAYRELVNMIPAGMSHAFHQTSQQIAAAVIYQSTQPVPPKTNQPLTLFSMHEFDVPDDVKLLIAYLAKAPSVEYETSYKGIVYGKGGAHFMRPGHHRNVYAFDFASLYPSLICRHSLLKTKDGNAIYKDKRDFRVNVTKHDKSRKLLDMGLKLFLNAPTGAFRIKSSYSTMFDPAAGEAMCYLGQLAISEVAFKCPDFEQLLEVNTDSVFVTGEANVAACRAIIPIMKEQHGLDLEEEFIPQLYARDVNNYIMYDENGNITGGKGVAYSDMLNKASNVVVYKALFKSLIKPELDLTDWNKDNWQDFIVKYHKSAASKYAMIDGAPMEHKNYYFMWTTEDCPAAKHISFSRDVIDRKSGAIKARIGVWSQDMEELKQYAQYIDFNQYRRDLDVELELWGRTDLVTTHLNKIQRKNIKTLGDLIRKDYI